MGNTKKNQQKTKNDKNAGDQRNTGDQSYDSFTPFSLRHFFYFGYKGLLSRAEGAKIVA